MIGRKVPVVGLGAGGHTRSLVDAIHSTNRYRVVAVADDDPDMVGKQILGVPIVAAAELKGLARYAFVGVGGITDSQPRTLTYRRLYRDGFRLLTIIHARASVSPYARLGAGVQILAGAVVNANAVLGNGVIVNSGAIVEHDCRVGDHSHIAPGAVLGGNVTVGDGCHVGIGAVVLQDGIVGNGSLIAAGAVVTRYVRQHEWVCGVPAHTLVRAA